MPSRRIRATRRARASRRIWLSLIGSLIVAGLSLFAVPSASANPAPGPGAVSRATAGTLPAGTVPDGTCAARVTAVGGGGASSPVSAGFGGTGGAGASISATFEVLPGQSYTGSVGGGGTLPSGGTGDGAVGTGGDGGTIVNQHRGGGGGGRTSVDLGGSTVLIAGGGGGGGAAHQVAPAGVGGGGGFTGIAPGTVAVGSNGQNGVDTGATANGGQGGQAAAGGAGGANTLNPVLDGANGGGIGVGTGGNGGPDPNYDSGGGGGGGYTGGGGGASTVVDNVSGAGGGGGSSWLAASSPTGAGSAPTAVSGSAGPASPAGQGSGAVGSISIDWVPCLYSLDINKTVSPTTVDAGDDVTWTVTVSNDGPHAMTRGDTVTLTDLLPAGPNGSPGPAFEVLSFNVAGGSNAELSRGAVSCTGVTVGAAMPASTVCSRAYSAPGAPETPSGGSRGLDPGETITITYRQIIANTATCHTITNTASADDRASTSGTTDLVGVIATQSDSATLTIDCYDLALTKTGSPTPVRQGGTITWTVTVTNNGDADMEGPTATGSNPLVVTDAFPSANVGAVSLDSATGPAGPCNLAGNTVTCGSGLDSGAQEVFTFTQTVDAGATIGATINNTASVTDPRAGDSNDSDTAQTTVADPGLSLAKSADPATYSAVGDVISYDYVVTNSGDVTLAGPVTVTDNRTTVSCPAVASLAPSASITCTATYTITQADLNSGSVTNTASASADGVTSPQDSATVTAVQQPGLNLAKSANPVSYDSAGDVISYSFVVTNSGNITLSGPFTVNDDRAVDESCPATASLDPGQSITCTATYTITQADVNSGTVTNTASATNGTVTSNTDSATVNAAQGPALNLAKSADSATYSAVGDVINYTFVVTNSGNVTLAGPFSVTDDLSTDESCPATASLDPGQSISCTASYTITQADLDAGVVTNVATASNGTVVSNNDSATVDAVQSPSISLVKSATTSTFDRTGDVIHYEYVVTNTGNVTLTGPVSVADDKTTVSCPPLSGIGDGDSNLDPGESVTCTSSYTVTAADVNANGVTNTATASAGGVDSGTEEATVDYTAPAPTPSPRRRSLPPTEARPGATSPLGDGLPIFVIGQLIVSVAILAYCLYALAPDPRSRSRRR